MSGQDNEIIHSENNQICLLCVLEGLNSEIWYFLLPLGQQQ